MNKDCTTCKCFSASIDSALGVDGFCVKSAEAIFYASYPQNCSEFELKTTIKNTCGECQHFTKFGMSHSDAMKGQGKCQITVNQLHNYLTQDPIKHNLYTSVDAESCEDFSPSKISPEPDDPKRCTNCKNFMETDSYLSAVVTDTLGFCKETHLDIHDDYHALNCSGFKSIDLNTKSEEHCKDCFYFKLQHSALDMCKYWNHPCPVAPTNKDCCSHFKRKEKVLELVKCPLVEGRCIDCEYLVKTGMSNSCSKTDSIVYQVDYKRYCKEFSLKYFKEVSSPKFNPVEIDLKQKKEAVSDKLPLNANRCQDCVSFYQPAKHCSRCSTNCSDFVKVPEIDSTKPKIFLPGKTQFFAKADYIHEPDQQQKIQKLEEELKALKNQTLTTKQKKEILPKSLGQRKVCFKTSLKDPKIVNKESKSELSVKGSTKEVKDET